MRDIFPLVNERAKMIDVLVDFGIQIDRKGKIICPFHADHKPSCKIYEKSFYCYACGTGGDCIKFVALYLKISNIEAARYLARYYGIDTDKPETLRERAAREARAEQQRKERWWKEWQEKAFRTLISYNNMLMEDEERHDEYFQQESIVEYYLECLDKDPEAFYQAYRGEVEKLERLITR